MMIQPYKVMYGAGSDIVGALEQRRDVTPVPR